MHLRRPHLRFDPFLLLATVLIAVFGAYNEWRSWNDGSRLATVESLVDFHTWQIDDSAYTSGMGDKVFINGHFYSDKAPVLPLAMAGVYKILQTTTGLHVRENPSRFYYLLTVIFTGSAYVLSVLWMDRLVAASGLPAHLRLALSWSFAFGTIALAYSRVINNHSILLALVAAFYLVLAKSSQAGGKTFSPWTIFAAGTLLGLIYSTELGTGPVLVVCATLWLGWHTRSLSTTMSVLAMALPWVLLHHILNYRIGGTFVPAGSVVRFFSWSGSPLAGLDGDGVVTVTRAGLAHQSFGEFVRYAWNLWFEQDRGFVFNNLPLYLALPAALFVWRQRDDENGLVRLSIGLIVGAWLLYALTSNSYGGRCCSIRWFLPLLAPFYYILIVFLKKYPAFHLPFVILSAWSIVLGFLLWWNGPWSAPIGPVLWYVDCLALFSVLAAWSYRRAQKADLTADLNRPKL